MINEVLTIKEARPSNFFPDELTLTFVELGHDFSFVVTHFRPLTTKTIEQDVQMILSLLTPEEVSA